MEVHRQILKEKCEEVDIMIKAAKISHYKERISECDNKELFRLTDKLLKSQKNPLPSSENSEDLAEKFSAFFSNKISKLRHDLDMERIDKHSGHNINPRIDNECRMSEFQPCTRDELFKIIMQSPTKSSILDPIPTWLLKKCLSSILPAMLQIVNMSMVQGAMPSQLKSAIVTPLIKKSNLDVENLKNYRPVSNLTFLSKIIERVIAARINKHMARHGVCEPYQSAYRQHHSTETAMIKVVSDLLLNIDNKRQSVLVMLDLSAAFDTVDHQILLDRLSTTVGLEGRALMWFGSYLSGRSQAVSVQGKMSSSRLLDYGVPQGSVLGPILFSLYTLPLGALIRSHGINYHLYADDTQLLQAFTSKNVPTTLMNIEKCVDDIKYWMTVNKLKLNDSKTEVIYISSPFTTNCSLPLRVGNTHITPVHVVRNLGVMLDYHLKMHDQVTALCRSAYAGIRKVSKIRHFLDEDSTKRLVQANVMSKLDYNNCLLYGLPQNLIDCLQRTQNTAARLVKRVKKHDHITPVLYDLHWLPIKQRVEYKLLLLCYKSLNGLAPQYLVDFLELYKPSRSLRSSGSHNLVVPKTSTKTYGDRAFVNAAPVLWNSLPLELKHAGSVDIFKNHLKTWLFNQAYKNMC